MQAHISEIRDAGAEVIGLSSWDDADGVQRLRAELGISFPVIPAPTRQLAEAYGVWNHEENAAFDTLIIDKVGTVRYRHVAKNSYDRPSVLDIVARLRGVN